jgi:hypothetical protein
MKMLIYICWIVLLHEEPPWYRWKIAHLAFNNDYSLTLINIVQLAGIRIMCQEWSNMSTVVSIYMKSELLSDCCLAQKFKFFSYIMDRTKYIRWWRLLCTRRMRLVEFWVLAHWNNSRHVASLLTHYSDSNATCLSVNCCFSELALNK